MSPQSPRERKRAADSKREGKYTTTKMKRTKDTYWGEIEGGGKMGKKSKQGKTEKKRKQYKEISVNL